MTSQLTYLSLGLAILFVAGVMPATANTHGETGDVGVCVIGVDSPCNAETPTDNQTLNQTDEQPIQYAPDELPYASEFADAEESVNEPREMPEMGVCVIGVDSPCNGDDYDGLEGKTPIVPEVNTLTPHMSFSESNLRMILFNTIQFLSI